MKIGRYLKLIWTDTIARLAGGLGVLLTFLSAFVFTDSESVRFVLLIGSLTAFLLASYRAWIGEHEERVRISGLMEPAVSITISDPSPVKAIGSRPFRTLRLRVKNIGYSTLFSLKAKISILDNDHRINEQLRMKGEGTPIVRGQAIPQHTLRHAYTFTLDPGEDQEIDVVAQEMGTEDVGRFHLCITQIGVDNFNSYLYMHNGHVKFSVDVYGSGMPSKRDSFIFILDKNGLLQIRDIADNSRLIAQSIV